MTISITEQLVTLFSDPKNIHSRQFTKSHRLIIISAAIIDLLAADQIAYKKIGSKQLVLGDNKRENTALNLMVMFVEVHEPTSKELLAYYTRVPHFSRFVQAIVQNSSLAATITVEQGGFLNNKPVYVSTQASLKRVQNRILRLVETLHRWQDQDVAFLTLYESANMDDNLLTSNQRKQLNQQLKSYKHAPENEFVFSSLRSLLTLSNEIIAS